MNELEEGSLLEVRREVRDYRTPESEKVLEAGSEKG